MPVCQCKRPAGYEISFCLYVSRRLVCDMESTAGIIKEASTYIFLIKDLEHPVVSGLVNVRKHFKGKC